MYIGEIMQERMQALNISAEHLAEESLTDIELIDDILNNNKTLEDIEEFDIEFISDVLYCSPEYFIDKEIRDKDILYSSLNRGVKDTKSNITKAKLQKFANDFSFLMEIVDEVESRG